MNRAEQRVLAGLRQIRGIETDESDLGQRLLQILLSATESSSVTLRRPLAGSEEVRVGRASVDGDDVACLEQRFSARSGVTVLSLEQSAPPPFDEDDASTLEALGGEVVLRLEQARAEIEASRSRRQIELLRALSCASESAPLPSEVADSAANELRATFSGAHVLVHIVLDHHLELVARRNPDGSIMADAPDWVRLVHLDGPTAMALAAREKRMVSRPARDVAQPRRAALEEMEIGHLLVVPLTSHEVVVGTLTIGRREDVEWDTDALRLLESIATQLGLELGRARLLEAERRRAEHLGLVNELGGLVAQHLELRAVLSTAARALARVLDVARVHVLLADNVTEHLKGVAFANDSVADLELPLRSSHAVAHSFRTRAPVIVEDAATDVRTNKALVEQVGTRSMAIVPLIARGEAIGVIVLVETRHKRLFTETEVARVVAVANVIAPAVTNAKMFEDVRRSYEALAKAQADLVTHERLAALGELSAVIAHEVRNPVAILYNSLSELRRLVPPEPAANMLLDIVGEETARLNRVVGDLLDFVRPYEVHPRPVRLDAVVKGAVDAAGRAAPDPCVDLRTELCLPSHELLFDGTMLHHALFNLIVNAIQATPKEKTVTIRASFVSGERGESLRCEVADEGLGIDDASSARIFQPFFTTKATGTGLGLAVVRRLADALRGTVVAENRPTGGALFTLTVPLA